MRTCSHAQELTFEEAHSALTHALLRVHGCWSLYRQAQARWTCRAIGRVRYEVSSGSCHSAMALATKGAGTLVGFATQVNTKRQPGRTSGQGCGQEIGVARWRSSWGSSGTCC